MSDVFTHCAAIIELSMSLSTTVSPARPKRFSLTMRVVIALLAFLHGPGAVGRRIYGALCALACAGGGYIAARHVYLQSLSPEELDGCAPSFEYALENYDALKFLKTIFIRDQDCGVIDWTFLGFSMPAWVLAGFVALFAASLWTGFRRG